MKHHISSLCRLAIVSLAAYPAFVLAVPATGSAYYTDATNSYVQDQTSQVMGQLNSILCFMGAMSPDLMVNSGDASGNYIALVDKNTCDAKGSGGQSDNTGAAYVPAVVHSTRASSTADMLVKAWLTFEKQGGTQEIKVYATASQAPSTTLPYGVFRMDYCGDTTNCALDKGYINATTSGLSFYSTYVEGLNSGTTALQLNAASSIAGNGAISENYDWSGTIGGSNFLFAYNSSPNKGYFVRNDGGGDLCFDRDPVNADESVWRYGLYDATTGARITRNSGFPIEYTDSVSGITSNGYIGYYGLWTQGAGPASPSTVQKVTYGSNGATKTPYTLLKTGGKLMKYKIAIKLLPALNKVTFWYRAPTTLTVTAGSITSMTGGSDYEIYWNGTTFMVSGQKGSSGNMEPLTTHGSIANADMMAAHTWGLFGWSQMLGGMFGITASEFAKLETAPSTILVNTQTQDVVYPTDFAGPLTCINNCPTAAQIALSNAASAISPITPFINPGWNTTSTLITYTLDPSTGNMLDSAPSAVISAATSGNNQWGIRSGRMVDAAGLSAITTAKGCTGPCPSYNPSDVDLLTAGSSYYVWETGGQPWNQIAILKDPTSGAPVVFDAPLQVSFAVPADPKYGSYQGATISLQYGGFGDLWGIPNECIDVSTNAACVFGTTPTAPNNQRWTSKFSIPLGPNGVVTTATATYWVKPLDKEVRLAKVDCSAVAGGLSTAGLTSSGLPVAGGWIDPAISVGGKPAVTAAPQVIHGVKQY